MQHGAQARAREVHRVGNRRDPRGGREPRVVEVVLEKRTHRLEGPGPWMVGRSERNDVVISDPYVSRMHAKISSVGGSLTVEDLGSANGTLRHGSPVRGRERIESGEEINFGGVAARVVRRGEGTVSAAPPSKGARLPDLPGVDGLRALAVIAVLIYHAGIAWLPGGFLGVEVFFVISGYLITALLLAEWRKEGRIDLGRFWVRRARRLLPALFVMLAATMAFAVAFLPEEVANLRGDVLAALGYVTNWYLIFGNESYFEAMGRPSLLKHLWSLAIEEQFYLLWPPVLTLAMAFFGSVRRRILVVLVALAGAVASGVWMAVLYQPEVDPSRLYYGTDTRAIGLLLGATLAFVWWPGRFRRTSERASGRSVPLTLDALGLAGLGGLVALFMFAGEFQPFLYHGGFALVGVCTAALISAVVHPRARLGSTLGVMPMRWLGLRSYGIYLWHWPVFMVSRPHLDVPLDGWQLLALRFGVVLILSDLSYRFVETPIRRGALGRLRRSWRESRGARRWALNLGWGASFTGAAACCALLGMAVAFAKPPEVPSYLQEKEIHTTVSKTTTQPPEPVGSAASGAAPSSEPRPAAPVPAPSGPVTAVGDSVMVGAADRMQTSMESLARIDAEVGLQSQTALGILQRLRAQDRLGEVVVVHVGNNGAITTAQVDAMMRTLDGAERVVLVNNRVPRVWEQQNNEVLSYAARRYRKAVLADWHAASTGRPELLYTDGIHLRPAGERLYAAMISEKVQATG